MATPCYYLTVTIRAYDAEVFVNGAPIIEASRAFPRIALIPVSEWMVQGENLLSVVIHGADHLDPPEEEVGVEPGTEGQEATSVESMSEEQALAPADAPPDEGEGEEGDGPPLIRVALCLGEVGQLVDPGSEREILLLEWDPPPPPGEDEEPLVLPHEVRETIDISHPWGTWSWEQAPAFDFDADPTVVLEITDLLADLHAALARGSLDPLLDRSWPKFDEIAPCYDFDPADARARLPSAWPDISGEEGFRLADFDPGNVELRLCCDGRIVEPMTLEGEPILRQAEAIDETSWGIPLFLARIEGVLTIVR